MTGKLEATGYDVKYGYKCFSEPEVFLDSQFLLVQLVVVTIRGFYPSYSIRLVAVLWGPRSPGYNN